MSIKEQKGRTFLTKEEIATRDSIVKEAKGLDQQFYILGQIVTSFFMKLEETKSGTETVNKMDKLFSETIKEKYGNVKITEEGEVMPATEDEAVIDEPSVEDVEVESI